MKTEKDYEEFLELLNRHNVKYCVIGSYALAFHSRPRYTKDIDILIEPTEENSKNILKALNEFGFGPLDLSIDDFKTEEHIIQLGYEPIRIDIITSIKGMDFSEIWKNKVEGPYGKQTIYYIDRNNLIKAKKISNRTQDKADIELLLNDNKE